jgi:hypothetical protein
MSIEMSFIAGGSRNEFRVVDEENCRIVYGNVPVDLIEGLIKGMSDKCVMDIRASTRLGANMVIGLPQDIERLLSKTPLRQLDEPWLSRIGQGAAKWAAQGEVGTSSNWLLFSLTGFNALGWLKGAGPAATAQLSHPQGVGDFWRCRMLLEAQPDLAHGLEKVAATSDAWRALVSRWGEICNSMDEEEPQWRTPQEASLLPKTTKLLSDILDVPAPQGTPKHQKP